MSTVAEIYSLLCNIFPKELSEIIIKKLCIINIRESLIKIGIIPNVLFDLLGNHKCVIAGSFVLYCLLNIKPKFDTCQGLSPPYHEQCVISNQDIDIFGQIDTVEDVKRKIYGVSEPIHSFEFELIRTMWSNDDYIRTDRDYGNLGINYARWYSELNIQFISINQIPEQYIRDHFDFSFCQVSFNGKDVYIPNFEDTIQMKGKLFKKCDAKFASIIDHTIKVTTLYEGDNLYAARMSPQFGKYPDVIAKLYLQPIKNETYSVDISHPLIKYALENHYAYIHSPTCGCNGGIKDTLIGPAISIDICDMSNSVLLVRIIKYIRRGFTILFIA